MEQYAREKLEKKQLDLIVANNISKQGAGFQGDTNIVTIYSNDGREQEYPLMKKKDVAAKIFDEVEQYAERNQLF